MLVQVDTFTDTPVMSLQTGSEIARTGQPVIDPRKLEIIAFYVSGPNLDFNPALLLTQDIREVSEPGFIINSSDELVAPEDMFSVKEILDLQFRLEGMKVFDDTGKKLGKITSYTIDSETLLVQQLYIQPPLLKSFFTAEHIVRRTQIINVTARSITVRSTRTPLHKTAEAPLLQNPFRSQEPKVKPES